MWDQHWTLGLNPGSSMPLTSYVTLGESLSLLVPLFHDLKNGNHDISCLRGPPGGFSEARGGWVTCPCLRLGLAAAWLTLSSGLFLSPVLAHSRSLLTVE